jgi:hypothetical protein
MREGCFKVANMGGHVIESLLDAINGRMHVPQMA